VYPVLCVFLSRIKFWVYCHTQLGIPSAKQKLRVIDGQHLNKDEFSLAKYNVPPGGVVDLGVKERGGRKK